LKGISTIMFVQPVNDFHSSHAFLHEVLDNVPLFHFCDKEAEDKVLFERQVTEQQATLNNMRDARSQLLQMKSAAV
jgi:hypothetical protein